MMTIREKYNLKISFDVFLREGRVFDCTQEHTRKEIRNSNDGAGNVCAVDVFGASERFEESPPERGAHKTVGNRVTTATRLGQ